VSDVNFSMGGYAAFVWPSVALVLGLLVWNIWSARRRLAQAMLRARRAQQARAGRS